MAFVNPATVQTTRENAAKRALSFIPAAAKSFSVKVNLCRFAGNARTNIEN